MCVLKSTVKKLALLCASFGIVALGAQLAWAVPPLAGVPDVHRAAIQKTREARAMYLPARVVRLGDRALQAYLSEKEPRDAAAILRAMDNTDASEFLPDLKKILTVKDRALAAEARAAIAEIIKGAEIKGRLSYRQMMSALNHYIFISGEAEGFPLSFRYPAAQPFLTDPLADLSVHGVGPIEVVQKPTSADGDLLAPRAYAAHDEEHFARLKLDSSKLSEEERFSKLLNRELRNMELDEVIRDHGLKQLRFNLFHEDPSSIDGLLRNLESVRDPALRQVVLENAVGIRTYVSESITKATVNDRSLVALQDRNLDRAIQMLESPDLLSRKISIDYLEEISSRTGGRIARGPAVHAVLLRAAGDADVQVRSAALLTLVQKQERLEPTTVRAVIQALSDPAVAAPGRFLSALEFTVPNAMSDAEFRTFVAAVLPKLDVLSDPAGSRILGILSHDPRISEAIRRVDPDLTILSSTANESVKPGKARMARQLMDAAKLDWARPERPGVLNVNPATVPRSKLGCVVRGMSALKSQLLKRLK